MPGIVEFPLVVQQAVETFGHLFANEPERRHFAEYLTGLFVAPRKNVAAITAEFADTTDQSCLNRWITEVPWSEVQLNEARLQWLQQNPATRYSARGVIPLDNVLIDHEGKLIEDVGYFWDHADKRYLIAHDVLIINYVVPSGKHYPLEFRRFRKKEEVSTEEEFKNHTVLSKELVDWALTHQIPGDFTFDSYFTHHELLNHIHNQGRNYVGDLKFNRKVYFQGWEIKASQVAARISPEDRKPMEILGRKQWYFTRTVRIPNVTHPVRLLILWERKNSKEPIKILVTNRVTWEAQRILGVYRHRWTGTETFHRDGKQHLGLGDCQLRSGQGQTRHMYLVFLAYSLLVAQMSHGRLRDWTKHLLTTIGEACRNLVRETLGNTVTWAIDRVLLDGWPPHKVRKRLALI
jgi:hypothetical protein